ncbi:MAG: nuclear transport factor 2 family protein [Ktedonobacterales bacterium]|nr:nuclear transport factor 2 family protein [Ktedonobacterales bacterium]
MGAEHTLVTMPSRLLVVEDDPDISMVLRALLEEEGYAVDMAASLEAALALVDERVYALILTDAFSRQSDHVLASAQALVARARPTPVGLMTGWLVSAEEATRTGYSFLVPKPFSVQDLLASIAAAIEAPLTSEQQRLVPVVERYFSALSARDWDGLVALCTEDVKYVPPGDTPHATSIQGRDAFRAYTERTFHAFPEARFEEISVRGLPTGLATRYQGSWRTRDGEWSRLSGAVIFHFREGRIAEIGIQLNEERLRADPPRS